MVLVAFSMAALTLGMYAYFQHLYGHDYARTIAFAALVVMQWANAINARSDYQSLLGRVKVWSGPFALGLTIAVILQTMALFGPLQSVVHVTPVAIGDLFVTGLIAFFVPITLVEAHKFIGRRRHLIMRAARR
jgi:magnesium-transporting ATPase (P-type)